MTPRIDALISEWLREGVYGRHYADQLKTVIADDQKEIAFLLRNEVVEKPSRQELIDALRAAAKLIDIALPKFNWGASWLDADAIRLLNEVPIKIRNVLTEAGALSPENVGWGDKREKS